VHKDIKPENIMMMSADHSSLELKIIDFGLASYVKDGNEF